MKYLTKANLLVLFTLMVKIVLIAACLLVAYQIYADKGISSSAGLLLM
ncbi:hypothetical protein [Winogradskyella sp. 3972H.M.0a.05]